MSVPVSCVLKSPVKSTLLVAWVKEHILDLAQTVMQVYVVKVKQHYTERRLLKLGGR